MSSAIEFEYGSRWEPPAPAVQVRLADSAEGAHREYVALLDTGADVTVVPRIVVDDLTLLQVGRMRFDAFSGGRSVRSACGVYRVHMELAGRVIGYIQVAEHEFAPGDDYMIIGRDVLNRFVGLFDGPSLRGELAAP